jgi:hypothetical protein
LRFQSPVQLLADRQGSETRAAQGQSIWVENHPPCGAFDIDWPAVLAVAAKVRDDRIGLLLILPQRLEAGQDLFQLGQFSFQPFRLLPGAFLHAFRLFNLSPAELQQLPILV